MNDLSAPAAASKAGVIHLTADERAMVEAILSRHVPDATVWVYGSRAKGRVKPWSDLDLAVRADAALPTETLGALNEAFDESDLPWKVDVIDWTTTDERFRALIAGNMREFRLALRREE